MDRLTKPVGEKDRKLIIHPKEAVLREGVRRDKANQLYIRGEEFIKLPDGEYVPERKEQGHRAIYCRDAEGNMHLYGRKLNVKKSYTDIWPKMQGNPHFRSLSPLTALDLELTWPGHPDSEVTTALKECPRELKPYFFAPLIVEGTLMIGDNSPTWIEGREWLRKWVSPDNMTKGYKPLYIAGKKKLSILQALLNIADHSGYEGYVLKGAACADWWKLKGVNEADVFVIGFKVSTAETRKGLVTAVQIGVLDKEGKIKDMGNVAGFSLDVMNEMAEARAKFGMTKKNPFLYRTLRVVYQEIAGQNGLKHGFYSCWRDDKNWESCSEDQFQFRGAE
jgi:hypothetical protein